MHVKGTVCDSVDDHKISSSGINQYLSTDLNVKDKRGKASLQLYCLGSPSCCLFSSRRLIKMNKNGHHLLSRQIQSRESHLANTVEQLERSLVERKRAMSYEDWGWLLRFHSSGGRRQSVICYCLTTETSAQKGRTSTSVDALRLFCSRSDVVGQYYSHYKVWSIMVFFYGVVPVWSHVKKWKT